MAQGAGANDDIDHAALIGGLTTVDDAGVGNETDCTSSRELMSAMSCSCSSEGTLWLVPVLAVVVAHVRCMLAVLD